MENMGIWEKLKKVPAKAKKNISGKRFKGTSINPMWRIEKMTEVFGVCGFGWRYEIIKSWSEPGSLDQLMCFVNINLWVKVEGEWSGAIAGNGGNMLVAKESKGLFTSDEGYKMALTDALSVAMKALGLGADVYWGNERSKYEGQENRSDLPDAEPPTQAQMKQIIKLLTEKQVKEEVLFKEYSIKSLDTLSNTMAGSAIKFLSMYKNPGTASERIMCPNVDKYVLAADCPTCTNRSGCPSFAADID